MKIGDLPSGPPPTGIVVALLANRALPGTDGYRRSALVYVSWIVVKQSLS